MSTGERMLGRLRQATQTDSITIASVPYVRLCRVLIKGRHNVIAVDLSRKMHVGIS
jgi:hypothetical protein